MATLKSLVDETTVIKNELKSCHTNLKNNLIAKGVECSDTDKMSSLVNKVGSVGVGINVQQGTTSIPAKSTKKAVTISSVDKNKSVCLCVHTFTGNLQSRYGMAIAKLESNTQISLSNYTSHSYDVPFHWTVIEFKSGVKKVHNVTLSNLSSTSNTVKTFTHGLNLNSPNKCLIYYTLRTTADVVGSPAVNVFNLTSNTVDVSFRELIVYDLYISIVEFE
jgi:hypothetical protein